MTVESATTPSLASERSVPATQLVVHHIEHLIFDAGLQPGAELPSESELATGLGLSRLTIREGIRTLVAHGLLEVRQGRRPVVAHATAEPLRAFFSASVRRDPRGLMDLLDVRMAIEVSASGLAAQHATNTDLESLKRAIESMRQYHDDETAFNDADVHFHAIIASASGNRIFDLIIESLDEPLHASRLETMRVYLSHQRPIEDLISQHERIYNAIAAHDGAAARIAMQQHLNRTREDLREAGRA